MSTISIQVLGDAVISRRFLRVGRNAADLSGSFDEILDAFEDWAGRQFDTQGQFFGAPWDELADDTIAQKARDGAADPAQALVMTGALALSLQGGPHGVREVGPDEARWGTTDENAMYHHGRRRSADNPVPRRAIFEPDETQRRWVMRVLQEGVFGGRG